MTLLNFHGSSVPFLPDCTEFFQTGQLFLSSSNEQRHGAATSYQRSDSINTGGCKKPTAPDCQLVQLCINVSACKSGLQDCSSTSACCSPHSKSMCLLLLALIPLPGSSPSCWLELCCVLVAVKSAVVVHKLWEGFRDAAPSNICCWGWMGRPRTEVTDALCSGEGEFEELSSTDCQGYATGALESCRDLCSGCAFPKIPRVPRTDTCCLPRHKGTKALSITELISPGCAAFVLAPRLM